MSASLVAHRYRTHKRLGAGSFGEIFVGSDVNTGLRVAMKFEKHGLRCPQLRHEYKVYRELQGCRGVCKVQRRSRVRRSRGRAVARGGGRARGRGRRDSSSTG